MKFVRVVVLIALAAGFVFAQDSRARLFEMLDARDYRGAAAQLDALRDADRNSFELNNYDYLRGRLAERLGDAATAAANYQAVVSRGSVLKEYALWRLASIARSGGNLLLERVYLQELRVSFPDSLLAGAARTRLARGFFESKSYDAAIAAFAELQNGLANSKPAAPNATPLEKTPRYRENLVYLAEAFLQAGRVDEAKATFAKLVDNLPNAGQPDDFALAGARGLDRIEAGANYGKSAPPLNETIHLQRASVYQFNRDFADARLHYAAIATNFPSSGFVPEALYQTGRGYVQEQNFVEAINYFERIREQFPDHPAAKDALTQAASAYARVGKPKEALARYQKFIAQYPDADNIERAYLNIIDLLRDGGEDTEALKWTAKTQETFRGKIPETLALFAQLRIRVVQSDWTNAVADADRLLGMPDLGGTRFPGATTKNEVTFIKAFALEQLKRFPEAVRVYLSIPDGRGEYYGWRATERLRALASNETAAPAVREMLAETTRSIGVRTSLQDALRLTPDAAARTPLLEQLRKVYAQTPEYQKVPQFRLLEFGRREVASGKREIARSAQTLADELLFLGLYDEGTPELERALAARGAALSQDENYTLAVFYMRGDMANRATAFAEPLWRNVPADYQLELIPREQLQLLYPAPYAAPLVKYAPERGVDPRFLLAIMRQESRFRADVKSNAAARGLMQFISTTSNQIAAELKIDNFRQDDLYDPPVAVLFGAQYLAKLYKEFPGGHAAVAASYNGGEDNVRRWLQRAKTDQPDRYVPEIVFSQSKDYAWKVMANYRIYQYLYDENLRAR